jgi:hypothetical protein
MALTGSIFAKISTKFTLFSDEIMECALVKQVLRYLMI